MDYNRSLIKQIEELTIKNETFKAANSKLRKENRGIRTELAYAKKTMATKIASAVKGEVMPLHNKVSELEKIIADKDNEILRLKAIINRDSSTSSKPPSTNGFKKIPNNREKSEKKQGGQPGHKGHSLKIPENIDELVKEGKATKKLVDYTEGADEFISKWVIDIDINVIYTEVRYPITIELEPELTPEVTYGNGIKALSVLLEQDGVIAIKRMSDLFSTITGSLVKPSKGTIQKFIAEFSGCLDSDIATIEEELLNGTVINVDDSPMRCAETCKYDENGTATIIKAEKTSFGVNIRTYSNDKATLFTVNPKKDDEGIIRDRILNIFEGILAHDHDKKFYKYVLLHATCCSHLGRDLKGLRDLYCCEWADDFLTFINEMNAHKKKDVTSGVSVCDETVLVEFMEKYDTLVALGDLVFEDMKPKTFGYDELRKMLSRLKEYKDAYTLFIRNYKAPFTNNLAERDLRSCKTRQKISGCFRTWKGISDFAKSKSVISTWKKQSLDLFSKISEKFSTPHFVAQTTNQ